MLNFGAKMLSKQFCLKTDLTQRMPMNAKALQRTRVTV
jgi:hypothetical protein